MILHSVKPNRITATKDQDYHLQYARWAFYTSYNQKHREYLSNNYINLKFYKGDQWILEEDLGAFFEDFSGNIRNRIQVTRNIIKPIVKYLESIAIQTGFYASPKCADDRVFSRRDQELMRLTSLNKITKAFPDFREGVMKRNPMLGSEDMESEVTASLNDVLERNTSLLIKHLYQVVDMEEVVVNIAKYLATTGIGIYKGYNHNMNYVGTHVHPNRFLFDRNAIKKDLSDAEYMGEICISTIPTLMELNPNVDRNIFDRIERDMMANYNYSRFIDMGMELSGSRTVNIEMYWTDVTRHKYAWIQNKHGLLMLTNVSVGEYKDFKPVPKDMLNEDQLEMSHGKSVIDVDADEIRYCNFIPNELSGNSVGDVVLDFGPLRYADKDRLNPRNARFPYSVYCYDYEDGVIISPVDDAINPQRMINRMLSIQESSVNNSHGGGSVIDKGFIANSEDDETELIGKIYRGEPIVGDVQRLGGAGNAIGSYHSNISKDVISIQATIEMYGRGVEGTTGINASMIGTDAASSQAVGIMQGRIAQGSMLQVPFAHAIWKVVKGATVHMCNVGRRIYADNPYLLSTVVGDNIGPIVMTKQMSLEAMRIVVERTEDEKTEIDKANGVLISLLTAQLVPDTFYGENYNRITMSELSDKLRDFFRQKAIADKQYNQQLQERESMMEQKIEQRYQEQKEFEMLREANKVNVATNRENVKERVNIRANNTKVLLKLGQQP